MKILTVNFLTCAVKACKSSPASFPLHFRDAELEGVDMEYNPAFLRNILPRVDWDALKITANELGFTKIPSEKPDLTIDPTEATAPAGSEGRGSVEAPEAADSMEEDPMVAVAPAESESGGVAGAAKDGDSMEEEDTDAREKLLRYLHKLLLETHVREGKMICGNCGHEYKIKEGIANFLLPNHLV